METIEAKHASDSVASTVEVTYLEILRERVQTSIEVREAALNGTVLETAAVIAREMVLALERGNKVLFFGNGGSSTDATHLSAELLGRYKLERKSLPSQCLADNVAAMTAIANDYGYEHVFSRQIQGLGKPGDVAVGLTTSGNSANVVRALQAARESNMITVAFTGANTGDVDAHSDYILHATSDDTPHIQELHMLMGHTICELVEKSLFGDTA